MPAIATLDTRHYSFTALGHDAEHARDLLMAAWHQHARATDADPDHVTRDDINVLHGPTGTAWRDGEPMPTAARAVALDRYTALVTAIVTTVGPIFHPDESGVDYLSLPGEYDPGDVDAIIADARRAGIDVYGVGDNVVMSALDIDPRP